MVQPILILSLADPDLGPDYVSVVHAATTILTNMVCIASMLFFLFLDCKFAVSCNICKYVF